MPPRGWFDALKRTRRGIRDTNASIIAAGVASYAFLALVPALIAVVAIYGLVANPADVKDQITSFTSALPRDAQKLVSSQLSSITGKAGSGTGIAAAIAIGAALWTASSIAALNTGLTVVNRENENPRAAQAALLGPRAHALRRGRRPPDAGSRRGAAVRGRQRRPQRHRRHRPRAGPVAAAGRHLVRRSDRHLPLRPPAPPATPHASRNATPRPPSSSTNERLLSTSRPGICSSNSGAGRSSSACSRAPTIPTVHSRASWKS